MCAFLTKPSMVDFFFTVFVSIIIVYFTIEGWHTWKKCVIAAALYIAGLITIIIPWYILLYLPHTHIYTIFLGRDIQYRTPISIQKILINIWKTPVSHYYSVYVPITFVCSLFFLLKIIIIITKKIIDKNTIPVEKLLPIEIFACIWFVGDIIFNAIINYKPLRFIIDIMPPLIILFVAFLKYIWETKTIIISKSNWLSTLAFTIWAIFVFHYLINENIYSLYERLPFSFIAYFAKEVPYSYYHAYILVISLASLTSIIYYTLSTILEGKSIKLPTRLMKLIGIAFLVASITYQINLYYTWATKHRSYKIIDYSRFLLNYIPKGPISGNIAPMLCSENEFKAYLIYKDRNNWCNQPFERYKITHMQMANPHDERNGYFYGFPDIMQKAKVVATFPLRGYIEELWQRDYIGLDPISIESYSPNQIKIKNADPKLSHYALLIQKNTNNPLEILHLQPNEEKILNYNKDEITFRYADYDFEFETARREVGMPSFDLNASNNIAVRSDKRPQSLIFIKWFPLPKNNYIINLRVKNENNQNKIAYFRMRLLNKNDEIIKNFLIPVPEIKEKYVEISASFSNPEDQDIIIEVYNPEIENIYFDIIQIIPIINN